MNVAIHLAQLGYKPKIVSSAGNDNDGKLLLGFIEETGVETGLLQKNRELPTSKVLITLDAEKNATYDIIEPVACDQIILTPELEDANKKAEIIIFGSLASRNKTTRETIISLLMNSSNSIKFMDLNFRPPYNNKEVVEQLLIYADIVKMNKEELWEIRKWNNIKTTCLERLLPWFADYYNVNQICVTRGKYGAVIFDGGNMVEHPGFFVNEIDSVGAGDAFLAGFIHCLIENKSLKETIDFACTLGAFVVASRGATPTYELGDIYKIARSWELRIV